MELRHLRYFVAVAEELNFCRAAERLHIAQPPLSLQIRHLEEELGAPLFYRVKRRLVLLPAGQTLLEEARALLAQAEQVKRRVRDVADGRTGRLAIGYVNTALYDLLPDALRLFRQRHPGVELSLEDMSSAAQVHALRRGQIQLGLLRPPISDDSLEIEDLVHESLMIAIPENHELGRKRHIRLADLAEEPFVICSADFEPSLYHCYTALFKSVGFEPRIVQEVNHLQTQLGLVAAGMGLSLVPSAVTYLPRPGVIYREVSCPQVTLPKSAAWVKGSSSPQLQGFLAAIRQTAARLRHPPLALVPATASSA